MTTLPQEGWHPGKLGERVLAAATELAALGIRVFPVHGLRRVPIPAGGDGDAVTTELRCTCGSASCPNSGKHPVGLLAPNGSNSASTDLAQVAAWFRVSVERPSWVPWNLGVATGGGLVVVDAEAKSNRPDLPTGLEVLDDWETWTGGSSLPPTRTIETGSGGLHLWLRVDPDLRIKPRNRVLPNVDVKGDGGYVLAPPSVHASGGQYSVRDPRELAYAPAPLRAWLLTVKGGRYVARRAAEGAFAPQPHDYDFHGILASAGCPAGHRDYFVNDLCFRLRRAGATLEEASAALRREWIRMERPGHDDFPWDVCLYKLRRVWEEVEPGEVVELPAWRPSRALGAAIGIVAPDTLGVERLLGELEDAAGEAGELVGGEGELAESGGLGAAGTFELFDRPDLTLQTTDTGNGIRFAQRMRDVVRYVPGEDRWYLWDGLRWAPDHLNRVMLLTSEIAKDLYVEAAGVANDEHRTQLTRWAQTTQAVARRQAMLTAAAAEVGIAVHADALDADPWLLVVRNGTLDLRTGLIRESLPTDLNTRRADVDFDAGATCPLWQKHVELVTGGDVGLQAWLRRAVGYTLTGSTGEHKVFFLQGTGNNGKSTFVDVVLRMLGDYASKADENLITGTGGHPTQLADLRGARLIFVDETDREKKLAEQRIKMMTGRHIKARFMRQDFFTYVPRFKLWIAGNHKPEIRGADEGIWRRLQLVPFDVEMSPDQKIIDYDQILMGELSGILNWALEGLRDWRELGQLGAPEAIVRATQEYRAEEDSIGLWLGEVARLGVKNAETPNGSLYESYRWWCHANGVQDVKSNIVLGRELAARGLERGSVKREGKMVRVWYGIDLVTYISGNQ